MKIATFATVLMLSSAAVPFVAAASEAETLKERVSGRFQLS